MLDFSAMLGKRKDSPKLAHHVQEEEVAL